MKVVPRHAPGASRTNSQQVDAINPMATGQFVKDEFDAFLECGILAHGFLRLRCGNCGHDKLVTFSCKRRGFCPSCGARRTAQTAAHLVDRFIPHVPVRQWVLSPPIPLRLLLAAQPKLVHFRPMFGSHGGAMHRTSLTFVSQAASAARWATPTA